MADTTFTSGTVIASSWLNDVNDATYNGTAVFTPAGTGAVASTVQSKLREIVSIKDFGAVWDGVADDTTAIQAAINAVSAAGGGLVYFPSGTGISGTLTLPSLVILQGQGSSATTLKLKDGNDASLIQTTDFATLTGQNKWFTDTEGVPYGFGIKGMTLDGNKANQSAGKVVKIYGKNYIIDDVVSMNSFGDGWYSECGYKGGQHDVHDMPEGYIDNLKVHLAGAIGVNYLGPHDLHIKSMFISQSASHGVVIAASTNVYQGNCDIDLIHSYGNTGIGVYINTMVNAGTIIGESNYQEGVVFDSSAGLAAVGIVRAFNNDIAGTSTYYNVKVNCAAQIGQLYITEAYQSLGGCNITASNPSIGHAYIQSTIAHSGKGMNINTVNDMTIDLSVKGYSGTGGIGFNVVNMQRSCVRVWTNTCKTHVNITAIGNSNDIILRGLSAAGETQYTGVTNFAGTNNVKMLYSDGTTPTAKVWTPKSETHFPISSITPSNNGELVFEATSNTQFTIKYKGSDGTVRSNVLTLT